MTQPPSDRRFIWHFTVNTGDEACKVNQWSNLSVDPYFQSLFVVA